MVGGTATRRKTRPLGVNAAAVALVAGGASVCALLAAPGTGFVQPTLPRSGLTAADREICEHFRTTVYGIKMKDGQPVARAPRERRKTEAEKRADDIVHAVVAVELLDWHGKLGGSLEAAFRKCVYDPVLPRLMRITNRAQSEDEDFHTDKNGKKLTRPNRVHDNLLERQFTLGNIFTRVALEALNRIDDAKWFPMAQYRSRQQFMISETKAEDDPQAKELVAWSQGTAKMPDGSTHKFRDRTIGHGEAEPNIWVLPVFVDHDRSAHAERQALLTFLEALPLDKDEGVAKGVTGKARVYASHTPCISCLCSFMQFTRAFEGASVKVTYDTWKTSRRWIGLEPPRNPKENEEDEEDE